MKERRTVDKKIFDEMVALIILNEKDLTTLGKAFKLCAEICDGGYINEGVPLPTVALLNGNLRYVVKYIKNLGGNPYFENGNKLFEIAIEEDGDFFFKPVGKFFHDAEGNLISAENLADLTCEINFDAIEYLETFTAYAHYIGGERKVIGYFDTKQELEKFMADLRKELGFVRNYDLTPLADDLVKNVKTEEVFWIEKDGDGKIIITSNEKTYGKFDSFHQAKRELRKMLYRG